MKNDSVKWILFLMSIGGMFIMLSPTEFGSKEHLFLGVFLIGLSLFLLYRNSDNKNMIDKDKIKKNSKKKRK